MASSHTNFNTGPDVAQPKKVRAGALTAGQRLRKVKTVTPSNTLPSSGQGTASDLVGAVAVPSRIIDITTHTQTLQVSDSHGTKKKNSNKLPKLNKNGAPKYDKRAPKFDPTARGDNGQRDNGKGKVYQVTRGNSFLQTCK